MLDRVSEHILWAVFSMPTCFYIVVFNRHGWVDDYIVLCELVKLGVRYIVAQVMD